MKWTEAGMVLLMSVSASASGWEPYRDEGPSDALIEGSYIVVLKDTALLHEGARMTQEQRLHYITDTAVELAARAHFEVGHVYSHALAGFSISEASGDAVRRLLHDVRVDFVEQDSWISLDPLADVMVGELPYQEYQASRSWGPDEVRYGLSQPNPSWGLDRIDQRDLPLSRSYYYTGTAADVRVYILDTGIRKTHQEFGGRVLSGANFTKDKKGSDDCRGHGTHVAGIVGGKTWGVAKEVRLVPVRVLNCHGKGRASWSTAGLDWVAAKHVPPAVVNMSYGGKPRRAEEKAISRLLSLGVPVVTSAGATNSNACKQSPARMNWVITVGATDNTDTKWSRSNHGACVNIFAPGAHIRSAWHTSDTAHAVRSGVSMAAPHVAGVAALWLSANPSMTSYGVHLNMVWRGTKGRLRDIGPGSPDILLYAH